MCVNLKKSSCTGCGACYSVCPTRAISMVKNYNGFYKPTIDNSKCIKCHVCENICFSGNYLNQPKDSYILRHSNYDVFKKSQSGGAFTLFSDYILDRDGVVFCACLTNENLRHVKIVNKRERDNCRGSLYIQSDISNIFTDLIQSLNSNKLVLFVGTPCQVSAIKSFVKTKNIEDKNLITIDLLCHGVTSPMILDAYIDY